MDYPKRVMGGVRTSTTLSDTRSFEASHALRTFVGGEIPPQWCCYEPATCAGRPRADQLATWRR
jgi:hypothetical protein